MNVADELAEASARWVTIALIVALASLTYFLTIFAGFAARTCFVIALFLGTAVMFALRIAATMATKRSFAYDEPTKAYVPALRRPTAAAEVVRRRQLPTNRLI